MDLRTSLCGHFSDFSPQTAAATLQTQHFAPSLQRQEESAGVQNDDHLQCAEKEILRLNAVLERARMSAVFQQSRIKGLQQQNRRLTERLQRSERRISALAFTKDDAELLRCVKGAELMLKEDHAEKFEHVFRRLALAILDRKLPIDSIELEYFCQLSVNISQKYSNRYSYTDNIMRFASVLSKLQSGRAVLNLFLAGSPDNEHVNWHFPRESSIKAWDDKNDVAPNFALGISEPTIQHMQDKTEGILRFGSDATDCHGTPGFCPGGKFDKGDIFFPGSGYDVDLLVAEYGVLARKVEKYAANPSSIEDASESNQKEFVESCQEIGTFLGLRVADMSRNADTLIDKMSKGRAEYQKLQTVRAQNKCLKKGAGKTRIPKEQEEHTTENSVSIFIFSVCVFAWEP